MGFMKGLGKGSMNLVTKPGSGRQFLQTSESTISLMCDLAMFGVLAYPAQGIYKSIKSSGNSTVEEAVRAEKLASYQRYIDKSGGRR